MYKRPVDDNSYLRNPQHTNPQVTLMTAFRTRLWGDYDKVKDKTPNCCIVRALNHSIGSRLYSSIEEFLKRV